MKRFHISYFNIQHPFWSENVNSSNNDQEDCRSGLNYKDPINMYRLINLIHEAKLMEVSYG